MNKGFHVHLIEAAGLDYHVNMGDLFDRPVVTPDTVMFAIKCYEEAVRRYPKTVFIVLAGNHDLNRDLTTTNSFDLFARVVQTFGVIVVREQAVVIDAMGFCPFSSTTSSQQIADFLDNQELEAVFGHWDLVNPASDHNMVPKMNTKLYVTGHDHKAREEERHGVRCICTGSMQAYAHGEGEPYRTVTLAELELISKDELQNLCVRVILAEGEELPLELDAMQISTVRETAGEEMNLQVEFEGFDMAAIFTDTMERSGVPASLSATLFDRYRNRA